MNTVARYGDNSLISFVELVFKRSGISIVSHPDLSLQWESPHPIFYKTDQRGKSPATYEALLELYKVLPADEHFRKFIPSKFSDWDRLLLVNGASISVKTEDMHGEYSATVFVSRESLYFDMVKNIFFAIKADNKAEPLWDAYKIAA